MKITFANSAWVRGPDRATRPGGGLRQVAMPVRYGLVLHPTRGPVLIDTGYTEAVTSGRRSRGLRLYARLLRPRPNPAQSLARVLAHFGLMTSDVQRIVVTHFHADHVSGLSAFPQAQVIGDLAALRAIRARGPMGNLRHGVFAELLPPDLEDRFVDVTALPSVETPLGLGQGHDLLGDGQMLAVPLPGHAEGHFGICFPALDPCFLYAADVQWQLAALDAPDRRALLSRLVPEDTAAAMANTQRVARFRDAGGAVMLCHDPRRHPLDWSGADA